MVRPYDTYEYFWLRQGTMAGTVSGKAAAQVIRAGVGGGFHPEYTADLNDPSQSLRVTQEGMTVEDCMEMHGLDRPTAELWLAYKGVEATGQAPEGAGAIAATQTIRVQGEVL